MALREQCKQFLNYLRVSSYIMDINTHEMTQTMGEEDGSDTSSYHLVYISFHQTMAFQLCQKCFLG